MRNTALHAFIENVMQIKAGYAGMGGASAAIVGAASTNDEVVGTLRKNALAFAAERAKPTPNPEHLLELADQVEGSLRSLQLVGVLSDERLEEFISQLDALSASL
ncbi:MAG: hypothetical protein ACR2FM_04350 [Candidatus Saccharimonadales bacterium]